MDSLKRQIKLKDDEFDSVEERLRDSNAAKTEAEGRLDESSRYASLNVQYIHADEQIEYHMQYGR